MMLPDNRNADAGNVGESGNHKAGGLASSMLQPTSDSSLRFEDRHAAWLAGVEQGRAERRDLEVTDVVQAALHDRALEALGLAKRSARHGEAFSQLVRESGERDD
jgi:hypothetical protein